jgi:uncharacterized protein with ParB-like and HNH nuclease domain
MSKITDNSNELSFHQLTSTSSMLLIPLFQRPYVWTKRQLDRMVHEIEAIAEKEDDSRFLGAVIAVTRPTNPSQPTPHEIVDGQQRLITMYLFLMAASQVAAREGQADYSRGLISANLIVDWAQELPSNTKLQPSISDRKQFSEIFKKVWNAGDLADWLPVKARLPYSEGDDNGPLLKQFDRIHKYLLKKVESHGFEELSKIVEVVRHRLTFVFILLKDPGSATTVFEGLNDPGVPISVGDLVKNEVFARVGYNEKEAKILHEHSWIPFRKKFGNKFDDFFFPFCVIYKANASRTEMFGELRKVWEGLSSKEIIANLDQFSTPYLSITGVVGAQEKYGKEVGQSINRLVELKHPSSTHPFLMRLLKEYENSTISKSDVLGCLDVLESFLVRRAICGIEPTGLLGLFRTMWSLCEGHPTHERISEIINKRLTIEWPSDDRVLKAVCGRPLYGSSVARFLILEHERSQGVEKPAVDELTIEHVMPRKYCDAWVHSISKESHSKMKDLWANLIPLSQTMNEHVDQAPYVEKRPYIGNESMYLTARNFGKEYDEWNEVKIAERSEILGQWAISRWVIPPKNSSAQK